jgi:anthranilate phosphoribosyltransferase
MIKQQIERVTAKGDLSFDDAHQVMLKIMTGEVNNSQIAALLAALKSKGETAEEVAGFAQAMRDKSIRIRCNDEQVIDVCGTGGDNSGTFNISTATSFVVAGAGVKVAKHGNRSISSKSGSADVMKELGANINLTPKYSEQALNEIGITFLFAPDYHPAMRHVAIVRKELGMKTVFNILGPLTNPAGTKKQLIGTFSTKASEVMANAVKFLGMKKVCFICTNNGYDEISLTDNTEVYEYSESHGLKKYNITNENFGFPKVDERELLGDGPSQNAKVIIDLLEKRHKNAVYFVTVANAAMALYSADYSTDLIHCTAAAEDSILSGKALDKLDQFISFGKNVL